MARARCEGSITDASLFFFFVLGEIRDFANVMFGSGSGCCGINGEGLLEGLDWLSAELG